MLLQSMSWSLAAAYLAALAIGYLLGSIPFGVIFTRMAGLGDIRAIGSGNIGATNVLRTGRRELALLTLLGDGLKGTIAVFAAAALAPYAGIVAGFAAFIGHVFPVWLRFRGGKGFATYLGVLAGLFWPAAIVSALVWFVTAVGTRYSSASALAASLATPPALLAFGQWEIAGLFVVLTAILWVKHAGNIRRLIAGTEGRIGEGR